MPLYEYQCAKCGHTFEKIESFSASAKKKCPKCGGRAERQLSASAVQFKGSGWYVTDYANRTSSGDGAKKELTAASDSKTDSKGDSKADAKDGPKPAKAGESKKSSAPAKAAE